MKLHTLIITTSRTPWFAEDYEAIKDTLLKADGLESVTFDVKHITPPPSVETEPKDEGRIITLDWFKKNIAVTGYDAVCFHFSRAEGRKWGLSKYNGLYWFDRDDIFDFYVMCDKGEKAQGYAGRSEFWRIFVHEIAHGALRNTGQYNALETVHYFDYELKSINSFFSIVDFREWNMLKKTRETLMEKLKTTLLNYFGVPHPLFRETYPISQGFGVENSAYRIGRHIGTDYATPIGTRLYAPYNGTAVSGFGEQVGNYIILTTGHGTFRFCHLLNQNQSTKGVKRGELIGWTGNSGKVTGAHLHMDCWHDEVSPAVLTPFNYLDYVFDGASLFDK